MAAQKNAQEERFERFAYRGDHQVGIVAAQHLYGLDFLVRPLVLVAFQLFELVAQLADALIAREQLPLQVAHEILLILLAERAQLVFELQAKLGDLRGFVQIGLAFDLEEPVAVKLISLIDGAKQQQQQQQFSSCQFRDTFVSLTK